MTSIKDIQVLTNFGQQVRLLFKLHIIWSVDSKESHENGCHQRSDFMAKMHPEPAGGAYSASPDPLAGFKEPTSKGKKGRGAKGKGAYGKEREGRKSRVPPPTF